ncbi:hypothetical protein D3C75_1001490 [compost metagenome]
MFILGAHTVYIDRTGGYAACIGIGEDQTLFPRLRDVHRVAYLLSDFTKIQHGILVERERRLRLRIRTLCFIAAGYWV